MNLKILKWLLAHRELLTKVLEVAKGYSNELPLLAKWEIADKVARLIIPVLDEGDIKAMAADLDWDADNTVSAFAVGAEYQALGIDWQFIITSLVPILRIILASLEVFMPDE